MDQDFIVGLLDEFGQNAKVDFPHKIKSLEHLHEVRDAELAELKGERWEGRSKFHGWTAGIVSITDTPHWDFLEGVKELNKELYDYRYNYVLK